MFSLLYQFLIRNKQVHLPGIGKIIVETNTAKTDFANKIILPPAYSFHFEQKENGSSIKLFTWLSQYLQISEFEASHKLNDFIYEIKQVLHSGRQVIWKGVGILESGEEGMIKFKPEEKDLVFIQQIVAEKIVREGARHTVLVGDKQKSSVEMAELLAQSELSGSSVLPAWWAGAIVITFIAIAIVGWHFSEHGWGVSATGYSKKVNIKEEYVTHKMIP